MMQDKKILFFNTRQWGYAASYYQYCKILAADGYNVTYMSLDHGLPELPPDGVRVIGLKAKASLAVRQYQIISSLVKLIRHDKIDAVLVTYFPLVFLLKIFAFRSNIIMDVKTGYIKSNPLMRELCNRVIGFNALFFPKISILSERLRVAIHLRKNKCYDLPLGGDLLSSPTIQNYTDGMRCLYVGSLHLREIDKTVEGFSLFYRKYHEKIPISYDIVGFGSATEEQKLIRSIEDNRMTGIVRFHGRKSNREVKEYLQRSNIGISFVPMTPAYDVQPPTKTFEYVLGGLVCIATATGENKRLINPDNGVLCQDDVASFTAALKEVFEKRLTYSYSAVVASLREYTWENICRTKLLPLLFEK